MIDDGSRRCLIKTKKFSDRHLQKPSDSDSGVAMTQTMPATVVSGAVLVPQGNVVVQPPAPAFSVMAQPVAANNEGAKPIVVAAQPAGFLW